MEGSSTMHKREAALNSAFDLEGYPVKKKSRSGSDDSGSSSRMSLSSEISSSAMQLGQRGNDLELLSLATEAMSSVTSSPQSYQSGVNTLQNRNNNSDKEESKAGKKKTKKHRNSEFVCDLCQKDFASRQGLQNHIQTVHLKKRTFECQQCNKKFSANGSLKRHIDTVHNGKRSFACPKCSKAFALKHHLKNHVTTVHRSASNHGSDDDDVDDNGSTMTTPKRRKSVNARAVKMEGSPLMNSLSHDVQLSPNPLYQLQVPMSSTENNSNTGNFLQTSDLLKSIGLNTAGPLSALLSAQPTNKLVLPVAPTGMLTPPQQTVSATTDLTSTTTSPVRKDVTTLLNELTQNRTVSGLGDTIRTHHEQNPLSKILLSNLTNTQRSSNTADDVVPYNAARNDKMNMNASLSSNGSNNTNNKNTTTKTSPFHLLLG